MLLKKHKILFLLIVFLITVNLPAQDETLVVNGFEIEENILSVSFRFDSLFSPDLVEGLERGLTVSIKYEIELWQDRAGWFDKFIFLKDTWFRVLYNRWQKKYILSSEGERRSTGSFDRVKEICTKVEKFHLRNINELKENTKYYILLKCVLEPMSIENIEEMSNWLRGKPRGEEQKKGVTTKIIELVTNVTGLGDQYVSIKSGFFKITGKYINLIEND
ncbi:DUF4390 domain-containing protein [candidate division KSB1 bacterium]